MNDNMIQISPEEYVRQFRAPTPPLVGSETSRVVERYYYPIEKQENNFQILALVAIIAIVALALSIIAISKKE